MRVILEYELDGIYMLKPNFQKTQKVKNFKDIFEDIEKLIDEVKL
jgi:type II restriction enzyme